MDSPTVDYEACLISAIRDEVKLNPNAVVDLENWPEEMIERMVRHFGYYDYVVIRKGHVIEFGNKFETPELLHG